MPMHLLEASVRSQPPVAIIDLQGEMTAEAEGVLNTAYAEAESQAPHIILLNFRGVRYINSSGIALTISLQARARTSHRRLLVCGLSNHYVEIFRLTRIIDPDLGVFPNEVSALAGC